MRYGIDLGPYMSKKGFLDLNPEIADLDRQGLILWINDGVTIIELDNEKIEVIQTESIINEE